MPSPRESLFILNLIPGLGSVRIQALLTFFGSAELVLAAPAAMLQQVKGIGPKVASFIADWQNCTNWQQEQQLAEQMGVRWVTLNDDEYPPALRQMYDPPIVLYVKGAWIGESYPKSVAIVGSRLATPYGLNAARRFARELGDAGCCIISGLAKGIDAAAHWGALDANAPTIGVLGSGHGCFYPDENRELADRMIAQGGAVVSEFPMMMSPSRTSFPQRNRIVAAWSSCTLVVEAPLRSGSLHTARLAADEYGRLVFAIPAGIDRATSAGCHELIRDGAILASSPQDILVDMPWQPKPPSQLELFTEAPKEKVLLASHGEFATICQAIEQGNDSLDALCTSLGMPAFELNSYLMRMQIEGIIKALPGARFEIKGTLS
ncbi:MAG: DNA-processing protein DprA [Akkermansia sp.]